MRQVTFPGFSSAGAIAKEEPAPPRHTWTEEPVKAAPEFTAAKGGALDDITRP